MKNTIAVILFGAIFAAFAWSLQPARTVPASPEIAEIVPLTEEEFSQFQSLLKENKALREQLAAAESEVARLNQVVAEHRDANRDAIKEQFRLQAELEAAKKRPAQQVRKAVAYERYGLFGRKRR